MRRILCCSVAIVLVCATTLTAAQIPGVDKGFTSSMAKAMGGATTQQAEGAAGAIFGLAKSRLSPADFSKVATAVPGMDGLLGAAPKTSTIGGLGGVTGLSSLSSQFTSLGLSPEMVGKAIPAVTNYVTKAGGADVGKLLAGVLK